MHSSLKTEIQANWLAQAFSVRDYWTWQVERTKKRYFEPWQEMQRTEVQIFTGNKSRQDREEREGE